jgi:hypothetical protein
MARVVVQQAVAPDVNRPLLFSRELYSSRAVHAGEPRTVGRHEVRHANARQDSHCIRIGGGTIYGGVAVYHRLRDRPLSVGRSRRVGCRGAPHVRKVCRRQSQRGVGYRSGSQPRGIFSNRDSGLGAVSFSSSAVFVGGYPCLVRTLRLASLRVGSRNGRPVRAPPNSALHRTSARHLLLLLHVPRVGRSR